jgi:hypothetical protein
MLDGFLPSPVHSETAARVTISRDYGLASSPCVILALKRRLTLADLLFTYLAPHRVAYGFVWS